MQFPMKRPREEADQYTGGRHLSNSGSSARITPFEINAKFSYKRKPIRTTIEQCNVSLEDKLFVILCSMQPLLGSWQRGKLCREGQPPCEGYFIAVDLNDPRTPIFEKGFLFYPPRDSYRNTKEALETLRNAIRRRHGIDPNDRHAMQQWCHEQQSRNDVSMVPCLTIDNLAGVLDAVIIAIDKMKSGVQSTTLFLTDTAELDEVRLSLHWMQSHTHMKLPQVAVRRAHEVLPDFDDVDLSKMASEGDAVVTHYGSRECDRCVAHGLTRLSEFGKPFLCCKEKTRILHRKLIALYDIANDVIDVDGTEAVTAGPSSQLEHQGGDDDDEPAFLKELDALRDEDGKNTSGAIKTVALQLPGTTTVGTATDVFVDRDVVSFDEEDDDESTALMDNTV